MSNDESDVLEREQLLRELTRLRELTDRLSSESEHLLESQAVLEDSRDYYADLYDCAPIAWLALDDDDCLQSLNQQALELFGQERRKLLGVPLKLLVVPEDRVRLCNHLLECRSGGASSCELRLVPREGARPALVRMISRRSAAQSAGCAVALLDLRERELAAEERERLTEGARALQAENEAKDQFIAMLSHELRTPLTPVLAAVSALAESSDISEELRATFAMLQRNVNAEAQLIDDLLDATRIARGKMSVERRALDVHALVHEALEILQPEIAAKGHVLEIALDAERHWVAGDPVRLRQVFWNLLRNAIKFTPSGGSIALRSWNHVSQIALEVADSGRGIEQQALPLLFRPFSQLHEESGGTRGGLGLGLAICRGIMELHQGQVRAQSAGKGLGARFVVDLATVAQPEARVSERKSLPPPPRERPRILLVEDHADTAEVLSELLDQAGYDVRTADSLQAARAADLDTIDLLVSDIGLGDGDGFDLMRSVRERSQVKAIALSGYGTEADKRASLEAGFDAHVTKPVNFENLLEVIQRFSH